ncbi:MAG: glycyl-radical enzyme activating protein [Clostridia bacterium]|nr:glycyl-radical enzyme activating protein [Clostridia bacterium]
MKAIVTDIQRFSLSDGKGIRTTVFFKGCNMHCLWCHNPETISKKSELMYYDNKCIACGKCFSVCPNHAHILADGKHIIDRTKCTSCGKCSAICYAEALVMCGKSMTCEDIMKEIRQDIPYYQNSGGGVTLSGGEILCQAEFVQELIHICHNENIEVAVETNISLSFSKIENLLKSTDLIMCDLKIYDEAEHKKYTGISNCTIIENLKKIDTLNIPFIVRTPLIPGATDSIENISAIANYIKDFKNLERYELLNYNPLGASKYQGLSKENSFEGARPFDTQQLKVYENLLSDAGISFKIV